ncbi:hypothetical protein SLEP1_g13878 [Rubroshorea leprosula]|uniref:Uncharacterized protein n=1 Tax=Rubroshorea leprosula TaxID=152421 RepID=A0AAV5ISS7_9ROSI|nr:hypothetical protein SLEP1_g13878 [Rubroshorea leprosula]
MDGDKKGQLPSTKSTSTMAKIKAIQPKKLAPCRSDQVFVPHMKSQILGPYFVSPRPIPFKLVYAQLKDHPLPFQVKPNWSKSILSSALLFWTVSFNCFHFPCGIMSVSLFNISSLTGLPCMAEEISTLLTMPLGIEYNHKDLKPSFPAFVRFACDRSPTKEFIPLVAALVHGRHLALDHDFVRSSFSTELHFLIQKTWWQGYFLFPLLGVLDDISTLTPLPLTKKLEEKDVIEEGGDLEFARDITEIDDDDVENELLAKLDMLADLPVKLESALNSKRKIVTEETNSDVNLPSQEQIRFAILTLQELIDGDLSDFYRVPDQQATFQVAQVLSRAPQLSSAQRKFWANFTIIYANFSKRFLALENKVMIVEYARKFVTYSTTTVFKKKDEFLAAKDAHTAQIKHLQGSKEPSTSAWVPRAPEFHRTQLPSNPGMLPGFDGTQARVRGTQGLGSRNPGVGSSNPGPWFDGTQDTWVPLNPSVLGSRNPGLGSFEPSAWV